MLGLKGDLEMVARDGFVEAHAGQPDIAPAGQVVGVDVVDAGPGAVDRGRVVVGRRRVGLFVGFDLPNLAAGVRQRPEVARGGGKSALDLASGATEQLLDGLRDCGGIAVQCGPRRPQILAQAQASCDLALFGPDQVQLLEPDPMQLGGIDVERGPRPNLSLV